MKLLLTTIAAVVLVGCGESQQSTPAPESKPVVKAPDISIHVAAELGNIEAVKQHLAAGTDVNVKGKLGSPLRYAVTAGRKEIVELLTANGADVNAKDDGGDRPLDLAKGEIADLLRKHGGKTGEELKGGEPVVEAAQSEPPATKPPVISIHDAVIGGNIDAIKQRLDADTDVNEKNEKGWAPVHFMAVTGNKEIAELLIKSGANVNANTDFGWTPLHLADTKEIAELLITKGANVNAKNNGGETPLDWATKRKHTETANLLRKHGAK